MNIIRLVFESFRFAWTALRMNKLRTILSLLGVTVGIFSIIGVLTLVDSLEKSLRDSFGFLGANVMYIQKWPWSFGDEDYPWWKYMQRPQSSYDEYEFIEANMDEGIGISIFADKSGLTAKAGSNSISGISLTGITYGHSEIYEMPIAEGRYFTMMEIEAGRNVVLIGSNVAEALFPNTSPSGQSIKIRGLRFLVVGVLKKQGENFIGMPTGDDNCFIPYKCFRKMYATRRMWGVESVVAVKGRDDDQQLKRLEGELTGLMRTKRGLRPLEESDFALNRSEMVGDQLTVLFNQLSFIGFLIGLFAILVGGFGIANIMFVSVKERTNIIGIQKSLGAKNYFILYQFLFEAIFLSVFGGLAGLFLVYLTTFIPIASFQIIMSIKNVFLGLIIAASIGTISGIVPAAIAARMDPVLAIRS
jgi:putative ABC transport system permease protein